MMDDDDSSCSGMSPSMDGSNHHATTNNNNNTAMMTVSPDDPLCVKVPAENDVLCGRGGSINSHPGNERFRTLVEKRKRVYLTARFKREKRLIASSIVSEIRTIQGRFLQRDAKSGLWKDIGDEKARDKTSQALRENAPSIRAEIEDEINELHHNNNNNNNNNHQSNSHHHHLSYNNSDNNSDSHQQPLLQSPSSHHYSPSSHHHQQQQQQQYGWYHPSYYGYPPPPPQPHPVHSASSSSHPFPPSHHHQQHQQHQHHTGYSPPPQQQQLPSLHQQQHLHNNHPSTYNNNSNSSSSPYTAATSSAPTSLLRPKTKRTNSSNMIDLTADFVSSGAEAIKSWTTKATGGSVTAAGTSSTTTAMTTRCDDAMTVATGTISYKHNDDSNDQHHHQHRRKMVKFRDDHHRQHQHSGTATAATSTNSIMQQQSSYDVDDEDLEPQSVDVATNASLMSQVANHILGSFGGSWQVADGAASICGGGSTSVFSNFYDTEDANSKIPKMPVTPPPNPAYHHHDMVDDEEEMNYEVEWEGQEVQLVVDDRRSNTDDIQRMPPPSPVSANRKRVGGGGNCNSSLHSRNSLNGRDSHMGTSIAFSSLGSCHSWLPEQMAAATSYFSGRTDPDVDNDDEDNINEHHHQRMMQQQHHHHHHHVGDYHSATGMGGGSIAQNSAIENYSMAGESIGGASLTKVFEHSQQQQQQQQHNDATAQPRNHHHHSWARSQQQQQQHVMPSPTFSHRELHQIPSWERSLRSKSPSSFNDDESLISKTDSSKGALSSMNGSTSHIDDMAWTRAV